MEWVLIAKDCTILFLLVHVTKEATNYCKICRRKLLIMQCSAAPRKIEPLHNCCDICTKTCSCNMNHGNSFPKYLHCVQETEQGDMICQIDDSGKIVLRERLEEVRRKYVSSESVVVMRKYHIRFSTAVL